MAVVVNESASAEAVDVELNDIADRVHAAENAIKALLHEQPTRVWTIRELQDAAAEEGGWTPSVVSIAYRRLARRDDVLTVGPDLKVRAVTA